MDKQYLAYLTIINAAKQEVRAVIIAPDYIVLTKKAYEAIIDYHRPEFKSIAFDEPLINDWIKQRFLKQDSEK